MNDFVGVKIALLVNDEVVVIQRDDKPGLRFAGLWDFPGGGREEDETRLECVTREVREELGIELDPRTVIWEREWPAMHDSSLSAYFMVARLDRRTLDGVKFGDEGQGWKLMPVDEFMRSSQVVPHLKLRLRNYLDVIGPPKRRRKV